MNETSQINDHEQLIISQVCPNQNHFCFSMICYAIFLVILTIVGILLNFSVIFITIRTKTFRGSVNILLAFYSFFEIINFCGNFLSIFTAFSGQYFLPFKQAHHFLLAPLMSTGCAVHLLFFIGIERLFVVLFPLKTFNTPRFLTFVLMFTVIQIVASAVVSFSYLDVKMNELEVVGNYYEISNIFYNSNVCLAFAFESAIIIVSTIIIYALIALIIHCRKVPSNSNAAQFNKSIFRSLLTIICFNIGGYVLALFTMIILKSVNSDSNSSILLNVNQICGILLHFSAASCGPILYLTSSEYRTAFQKELALFFKLICVHSSAVSPQQ